MKVQVDSKLLHALEESHETTYCVLFHGMWVLGQDKKLYCSSCNAVFTKEKENLTCHHDKCGLVATIQNARHVMDAIKMEKP